MIYNIAKWMEQTEEHFCKEDLIYKLRNDLEILKSKELEYIFIEIVNPKHKNVIVGCIYCHLCMEIKEFNDRFMTYINENLLKRKSKHIVLMGDFNADLLKYENDTHTTNFLNQIYESAKLHALRVLVPYMPRALRALVPYVPRALRASRTSCPTCSRASHTSCPVCSRALHASCLTCSRALRALVPHVPRAQHALVPYMVSCLTCLVPYVFSWLMPYMVSCLTCLVPYVLLCPTCLVSYMLLCLTCLVPYVPRAKRALVSHMS